MKKKINDGGSIFPTLSTHPECDSYGNRFTNVSLRNDGLSKRELYALVAMHAYMTRRGTDTFDRKGLAGSAFEMADAMLEFQSTKNKGGRDE